MKTMYVIVKVDKGDGYHRLGVSGMQVYEDRETAEEDLRRFLFKAGYAVLPITVCTEPTLAGTAQQREDWNNKRKR